MELFLEFLKSFKELAGTPTALVLVFIFAFVLGDRLRKKLGEYATVKDLNDHKKAIYNELLVREGSITSTLAEFKSERNKDKRENDYKFKLVDEKVLPLVSEVHKRIQKQDLSLAQIKGKLGIVEE